MKFLNPEPRTGAAGFTLIELVIAIAILAIVVGIAIPAYTQQVTKTHRTEGKRALLETVQALERCYTRYSSYTHDDCNVSFPIDTENSHYELTATLTATTFVLNATPQGSQANRDNRCGTFTISHTGRKDMVDPPTGGWDAERCWN